MDTPRPQQRQRESPDIIIAAKLSKSTSNVAHQHQNPPNQKQFLHTLESLLVTGLRSQYELKPILASSYMGFAE